MPDPAVIRLSRSLNRKSMKGTKDMKRSAGIQASSCRTPKALGTD
jgi:hypothetical protein